MSKHFLKSQKRCDQVGKVVKRFVSKKISAKVSELWWAIVSWEHAILAKVYIFNDCFADFERIGKIDFMHKILSASNEMEVQ